MSEVSKILVVFGVSCLFFLASCKSVFQTPPLVQKEPDKISHPTKTVVQNETYTEITKGTSVQTGEAEKVEASLAKETKAEVVATPSILQIMEEPREVVLPKGTGVVLPPQTDLVVTEPASVVLEAGSEIVLPVGTEISISKVNWYAVMFYCLLAGGLFWYFLQGRRLPEDQNSDGFVDDDKVMAKKKIEPKKKPKSKK